MEKMKVLYVTHEMTPYLELSEMAETAREIPQYMQDKNHEVRVFMPRFGNIKERKHRLHEVIRLSGINIPVGDDDNPLIIKVASLPSAKMQIYFLDNDDFFSRKEVFTDDNEKFFEDNDDRFIFFNKGVIEIILKLGWVPDVVHCMGWMSSLVPLYARTVSKNIPVFKNTKFIYSPYKTEFKESLGKAFIEKAMINGQDSEIFKTLENPKCDELYMAGATFADAIVMGHKDVDASVNECIDKLDKPVLTYEEANAGNIAEKYEEFYQTLFEEELLENNS